ncbi:MAG: YlbL family protein [Actinomycetota bacterium]
MHRPEWELPEPPGVEPVVGPRVWRLIIAVGIIVAVGLLAFYVRIPSLVAFVPGPVRDAEELVEVEGATTYSSEGQLFLTTVSVDSSVTLVEWISSGFDPDVTVISEEDFTGGLSIEELRKRNAQQMRSSKLHAREVALGELGLGPEGDGARVKRTFEGLPAEGILQRGDVIVKINSEAISTTCDVTSVLRDVGIGSEVEVTVRRKGNLETLTLTTAGHPDDPSFPVLGVLIRDVNYRFDPGLEVKIETGEIGGPSAGLMFALALYDRLTPDDLTDGRSIAGTGTIACDGRIGAISGIEQKVAGAEEEGAEIFLVPIANADGARDAADDIEVVPVETFDDAVSYLESL